MATPPGSSLVAGQDFLFVQTFGGGAWAPKAGSDGVYTLTLTGSSDQTIYFTDRPDRIVGTIPMQQFLDGLGFTPINPPNAALVARTDAGEDVLVIELINPRYEADAGTLTYEARVLENYVEEGLRLLADKQGDVTMPSRFGSASLFIYGCPDIAWCYLPGDPPINVGSILNGPIAMCYPVDSPICVPCNGYGVNSYDEICNYLYGICDGTCFAG